MIQDFNAAMARLGPFGQPPLLAVAVSGGADSTALALLADDWARTRGGEIRALIIDHGLRPEAAAEAEATSRRLGERGIASRIIRLALKTGPALQERARSARLDALAAVAREAGIVHVLLGHHWRDQSETIAMRAARGTGGLEGMAAVTPRHDVLMIRPLLHLDPVLLRDFLRAAGCAWVEDPSNHDPRFERARVRSLQDGRPRVHRAVARDAAEARAERDHGVAAELAAQAEIHPEGYALWNGDTMTIKALAALLRAVAGRSYPPDQSALRDLAAALRPACLGGVQVARWRNKWLFAREPAACTSKIAFANGMIWDGRFQLTMEASSESNIVAALGKHAADFRSLTDLPSIIMKTLPTVHHCETIIAIPHLCHGLPCRAKFHPPSPAAPLPFVSHPFVYAAALPEAAEA